MDCCQEVAGLRHLAPEPAGGLPGDVVEGELVLVRLERVYPHPGDREDLRICREAGAGGHDPEELPTVLVPLEGVELSSLQVVQAGQLQGEN